MPTPAAISAPALTTGPSDEELAGRAKKGDLGARNDLLRRYQSALRIRVRGYSRAPIPEAALEGEAMRLLLFAADRFDPKAGVKFKTFLDTYLKGLYRYTAKHQNIARIPEHQVMEITRYRNTKDLLQAQKRREPTHEEMADSLGWSSSQVQRLETSLSRRDIASSGIETTHEIQRLNERMDQVLEFEYFSMTPKEKLVYDYSLGRHGRPRIAGVEDISKKTGISAGDVYSVKRDLAKRITARL